MSNRLSTQAFRDDVEAAIAGVAMFVASHPGDQMLRSIKAQLAFVIDWSSGGAHLEDPRLDELNFGVMAAHAVADLDDLLPFSLYSIASEIDAARKPYT
jgi:hypothetical protein